MNFASVARVRAQVAGDAVVKAHADGDQQVGFLNRVFTQASPCMPIMPRFIGSWAGKQPMPRSVMATGMLLVCTNFSNTLHRAGKHDSAAGQNDRTLRGVQQFDGAVKFRLVVILAHALGRQFGRAGIPIEFGSSLLRVFGDVHEHRAGPPGVGDEKRFAHGARNIFGSGDDHVVLRDRHGDAGDVDFLKGVGAEKFAADLAGDADDRRRIEHRGGNAGDHVRCAGAGSRHGHADAAGGARITVGHVRGALFVTHQNVVELGFAERVVHRKNRASRIAENVPHAESRERFAENFRTGQLHSVLPEDTGVTPDEKLAGTVVMAPSDEDETSKAYLAMTPCE